MNEERIERQQPHSDEAEASVLGAVLLDKDALFEVLEILRPQDFYQEKHKEIFEAVRALAQRSEPVDIVTVSEELKKRNRLDMVGGAGYIGRLSADVPVTSNAAPYARIVAEKAMLRSLISAASEIEKRGYQDQTDAREALEFAEGRIFEIAQSRQTREYAPLKDVLYENLQLIDAAAKNPGGLTGVTTGFIDLDKQTSGLQRSDLIILAARPSMGKTALALNIAQNAAIKGGAKVMIFSLEMPKTQLGQRLLAMEARVDSQKLKTGALEREDWEKIQPALDKLYQAEIFIDDTPGINVMEIKNKCRRLKADKGLDLIIIDYLQIMGYEGRSDNRQQEITTICRFLKQLAREMDCPILLLSQLSRGPEQRTDHRPVLSDLRESGSIEQDADMVIFLYRDSYYNKESEAGNLCEVNLAKHRNGPVGKIDLTWLEKYTKFADSARKG